MRREPRATGVAGMLIAAVLAFPLAGAEQPVVLASFETLPRIVELPDLTLWGLAVEPQADPPRVGVRRSGDAGRTWSSTETLLPLPREEGGWLYTEALVEPNGEIQLFLLNDRRTGVVQGGEGQRPRVGGMRERRIDIWHTRSSGGRKEWPPPRRIWQGYTGALNSVLQLRSGRILLPFSYLTERVWRNRGEGLDAFTFYGQFNSTLVYSDDHGVTWRQPPVHLKVQTPDIVSAYGAVEPVAVELGDGAVWMLIRTQRGRFYESRSADGLSWSEPQPTAILSSDSPAGLVRLKDGRLVLLWNNCLRFPYAHGGRHVLHAAVSEDRGKTWIGYREVVRDPKRGEPPPPSGDHGTGYPYPAALSNGKVIFSTGQGHGRRLAVELDPAWLYETQQTEDFRHGLESWSVFGTRGVALEGNRLVVRRTSPEWPAAAVWNFPNGRAGRLTLRLETEPGFRSGAILLSDHYSVPFDKEDALYSLFDFPLESAGLPPGREKELTFDWDLERQECRVTVNGRALTTMPLQRQGAGVNYLRLRAHHGGFQVSRVDTRIAKR